MYISASVSQLFLANTSRVGPRRATLPWFRTVTVSETSQIRSMSWSMSTTALPRSLRRPIMRSILRRDAASRPTRGSSSTTTSGSSTRAEVAVTSLRWPPGMRLGSCPSSPSSSSESPRARATLSEIPASSKSSRFPNHPVLSNLRHRRGKEISSATVRSLICSSGFWKAAPTFHASSVAVVSRVSTPATVTVPSLGLLTPKIIFASVVLPAPLPPMRACASPRRTTKFTPSTATVPSG